MNTQDIIKPEGFENEIIFDLPEEQYHADKSCVSSSYLRQMIKSPKHFQYSFIKGHKVEQTAAMSLGKAIHMALLEPERFKANYRIKPEFEGLTQDGRPTKSRNAKSVIDAEAKWLADLPPGAVVVTEDEVRTITEIASSINDHQDAIGVFKNCSTEVTMTYRDPVTGIGVKTRPDILSKNAVIKCDLKSTSFDISEMNPVNYIYRKRFDFQSFTYDEAVEQVLHNRPEINLIILCQTTSPWPVYVHFFTANDFALAGQEYRNALTKISECLKTDRWPGPQVVMEQASAPEWFLNKAAMQEDANG